MHAADGGVNQVYSGLKVGWMMTGMAWHKSTDVHTENQATCAFIASHAMIHVMTTRNQANYNEQTNRTHAHAHASHSMHAPAS